MWKKIRNSRRQKSSAAEAWIGSSSSGEGLEGRTEEMAAAFVRAEVSRGARWILPWPRFSSNPFCPITPCSSGFVEKLLLLCPLRKYKRKRRNTSSIQCGDIKHWGNDFPAKISKSTRCHFLKYYLVAIAWHMLLYWRELSQSMTEVCHVGAEAKHEKLIRQPRNEDSLTHTFACGFLLKANACSAG